MNSYRFLLFSVLLATSFLVAAPAKAQLLPEGILGMQLGDSRTDTITNLVNAGVAIDAQKTVCFEKVPEKNKGIANRICKLSILPGSVYLGQSVNKVSLMLRDEAVVLIGADLGSTASTYDFFRESFQIRWNAPLKEHKGSDAIWRERPDLEPSGQNTQIRLYTDKKNALLVYSFDNVQ